MLSAVAITILSPRAKEVIALCGPSLVCIQRNIHLGMVQLAAVQVSLPYSRAFVKLFRKFERAIKKHHLRYDIRHSAVAQASKCIHIPDATSVVLEAWSRAAKNKV